MLANVKRSRHLQNNKVVELRDYQQDVLDEWMATDKDLALSTNRRFGKSIVILRYIDKVLSENPNHICYFFANTLEQATDIVAKNTTQDGRPYIGAVINPKHLVPNNRGQYLHDGKEIRYKNGSRLKLAGVINSTVSKQGTNVNLVVYDEAALYGSKFFELYDLMSPSLALTGGRQIATSTVRFGSDFNKIFTQRQGDWHRVIRRADEVYHNGERVFTDEFLEKQKAKQSEERYKQEWMCDMDVANEESIYNNSFKMAEFVDDFVLRKDDKIFCSQDLGISDQTALCFGVKRDDEIIIFDYYENNNEPTQHYIDNLNNRPYLLESLISPHDSRNRHDAGEYLTSRAHLYAKAGFNVEVLRAIKQTKGIEVLRTAIQKHKIKFARTKTVLDMVDEIKKYEWKKGKEGIEYTPVHNKASNTADALEYMAIYFYYHEYTEDTKSIATTFTY